MKSYREHLVEFRRLNPAAQRAVDGFNMGKPPVMTPAEQEQMKNNAIDAALAGIKQLPSDDPTVARFAELSDLQVKRALEGDYDSAMRLDPGYVEPANWLTELLVGGLGIRALGRLFAAFGIKKASNVALSRTMATAADDLSRAAIRQAARVSARRTAASKAADRALATASRNVMSRGAAYSAPRGFLGRIGSSATRLLAKVGITAATLKLLADAVVKFLEKHGGKLFAGLAAAGVSYMVLNRVMKKVIKDRKLVSAIEQAAERGDDVLAKEILLDGMASHGLDLEKVKKKIGPDAYERLIND